MKLIYQRNEARNYVGVQQSIFNTIGNEKEMLALEMKNQKIELEHKLLKRCDQHLSRRVRGSICSKFNPELTNEACVDTFQRERMIVDCLGHEKHNEQTSIEDCNTLNEKCKISSDKFRNLIKSNFLKKRKVQVKEDFIQFVKDMPNSLIGDGISQNKDMKPILRKVDAEISVLQWDIGLKCKDKPTSAVSSGLEKTISENFRKILKGKLQRAMKLNYMEVNQNNKLYGGVQTVSLEVKTEKENRKRLLLNKTDLEHEYNKNLLGQKIACNFRKILKNNLSKKVKSILSNAEVKR